jgi:hypothetical protein
MPDRTLSELLAADHAQLARELEKSALTGKVMARIGRRARLKAMVLGSAAIAGAALAASQISALHVGALHLDGFSLGGPGVAALAGAALIAATSAVLGWNLGQD